jgi:hypothetical protein
MPGAACAFPTDGECFSDYSPEIGDLICHRICAALLRCMRLLLALSVSATLSELRLLSEVKRPSMLRRGNTCH